MKSWNQTEIRRAFTQQASGFESNRMNFSQKEYLDYAVSKIAPAKTDNVLEVAAGTCACGRAIAPYAGSVTCLDMTPAMLSVGRTEAEKERLCNIEFVVGDAAELPFPDNRFDIVLSRLAFHHFPDAEMPFSEMRRVLRPGGKLVLIDMEAAEDSLRETEDKIERLRDPSHVRNLSRAEMLELYRKHDLSVSCCETVKMPMILQNWLDHTATPVSVQKEIKALMDEELAGGRKTGFAPYTEGTTVRFDHRWVLTIGKNKAVPGISKESAPVTRWE